MASPHPGLRIVALLVVGLAIGASVSNPVTASRSPADHPGHATVASELPTRLPLKVDSINQGGGSGIRLVQTGSAAPKPDAAEPAGRVVLEASKADDPGGRWNAYSVSTITGCADQPLVGFSDLVVIISANDFSSCTSGKPSYLGVQYWVLNKTDLVSGAAARTMSFGPDPTLFSVHPGQSLRPTDAQFMVSTGSGPTSTLTLYSVTGVPPGLVLVTPQNLGIRATAIPPSAPQLGSRSTLDTADNRVQDAMWADSRLWLSLADGCIPAGDNRVRSCVRLIEVDTANGTTAQDFDVGISGKYLFYPALRTDADGNLVVVFGYSSATEYPEMRVATRSVHDPPNTIGAPQVLRAGEGPEVSGCPNNSVCRYGDYFGASQDPSDPGIVWVAGEYGTATGWATFIAAMAETVRFTAGYAVQGGGSGYAAPSVSYEQFALARSNDANLTVWVDAGSPYSFPSSLGGSNASERWMADAPDRSGTVGVSAVVEIAYRHQAFLMFGFQGPAESSMSPRTGWYDVGASLRPSVNPAAGWAGGARHGPGPRALLRRQASPTILGVGPVSEIALLYPGLTITAGARRFGSFAFGGASRTLAGGAFPTVHVSPRA